MGKRKRSGSFSKSDDPGTKRSDAEDSQEELEGENVTCTTKGTTSGGVGIRCSARVQEKQEKLRRESSPSKQILPLEVNCSSSATGGNTVSNVSKGNVKFPSPNNESATTASETGANAQTGPVLEEKRKKRTWELWSVEDKQMFFDALNENGKDFDAIQNYLATKAKSRKSGVCGQYVPKNKDQVRHFYYRTWNKISKYLRFPDGMKKANQELYGLINYGELRKKQRILNSKSATKLRELMENGMTSIKFRSKTCRIKTPVCRALKRLNGLENIVEHSRVPHKVSLEFIPKDGKTWRSVQSISHNPRVKMLVGLQRTFASIISHLENKWKRKDDRLKEQFSSVFGKPRARLRVMPADYKDINIPLYRVAENTSAATICLRAYQKNVLVINPHNETESSSKMKRKRKQSGGGNVVVNCSIGVPVVSVKRLTTSDYPMDPETSDAESQSAVLFPVTSDLQSNFRDDHAQFFAEQSDENAVSMKEEMFARHLKSVEDYSTVVQEVCYQVDEVHNGDVNNLPTETDNEDIEHELDEAPEKCHAAGSKPTKSETVISHLWDEEQVKRGWTVEEIGIMTVGEVYLMLGQTEKISFEYFWDGMDSPENVRFHGLLDKLITTATLLRKKKTSRSKASTSQTASIKCGSQLKCSTCGLSLEIPPNPSCASRTCSTPATNIFTIPPFKINASYSSCLNDKKLSTVPPHTHTSTESAIALTPSVAKFSSTTVNSSEYARSNGLDPDKPITLNQLMNINTESGSLHDNQMIFRASELNEISPVNVISNRVYNNNDNKSSAPSMSSGALNSNTTGKNEGIVELCSLASNQYNNSTLLPDSPCMIRNPSGSFSVVSQQDVGQRTNSDLRTTEQITFHRPAQLRSLEPAQPSGESVEFPPPKPFLDLPKGNRRLGRRPNFKRVVIPRVLPLLPKSQAIVSVIPTMTDGISNHLSLPNNVIPVRKLSIIPCGVSGIKRAVPSSESNVTTSQIPYSPKGRNYTNQGYSQDSSSTTSRKCPETISYEMFMNVAGNLSCNSNDFEDLLKVKRNEGNSNISSGDVDSLSLSSFMEISLPESAKMTANDLNIDDLDIMEKDPTMPSKDLVTPDSSQTKRFVVGGAIGSDLMPDFDKSWSMDGGDLSLSNFFNFNSQRGNASEIPDNEVNFQTILDDRSLDFSSKLTEIASPMSDGRK